ncbi:HVO_0234 family beta-propeller protein [Halomarina ordinaria]|uniref:HVO-0234-like beta-propeller domain-containing protein n=1 Tax=Halomarina ordinaria TaxID=3033939 RepID=A0ABD5U9H5_9EURY|nr:hypothetical protein [Halomarina sp. PSRA2]
MDEDIDIDEKRVYAAKGDRTVVFVATDAGLARVSVSGDLVGEFGLDHRGDVADVATRDGALAVAGEEDVLVGDAFAPTGFGPADAVGFDRNGHLVAAGEGRVARLASDGWTTLAAVEDVRAVDGDLLAARDGVFRLDGAHVGLADVRDVAAAGVPLAATDEGLYRLGNGWMDVLDGAFRVVACEGAAPDARAHAAGEALYERREDAWKAVSLPTDDPVAAVGYGESTYLVTASGTFLVRGEEGWRSRSLGVPGVRALAVL